MRSSIKRKSNINVKASKYTDDDTGLEKSFFVSVYTDQKYFIILNYYTFASVYLNKSIF
ncbi:MAG: hypothetical protein ACI8P3_000080 [Saprospiraceae bacterium]|jgi:hypothetical protein